MLAGGRRSIGRFLRTILYPIVRNHPTFGRKNLNRKGRTSEARSRARESVAAGSMECKRGAGNEKLLKCALTREREVSVGRGAFDRQG